MAVYVSSGGGVRIGATFGAALMGEGLNAFDPKAFDWYVGTSAGALDAALTANGWSASKKVDLFLETDFAQFFTPALVPFGLRKALALQWPISLKRLAKFIDGLGLTQFDTLVVNAVDSESNEHVIYCENRPPWLVMRKGMRVEERAFSLLGLGTVLTRSMVLPGLEADHPKWCDGGFAQNPLLSIIPPYCKGLVMSLGYPGLVEKDGKRYPTGVLDRALYALEMRGADTLADNLSERVGLKVIESKVYDVDSAAFNLSWWQKRDMVERAMKNTANQWV